MGIVTELLKDIAKSGPDNVKKLMAALDKLPSDNTLERMALTLDKFAPYLPELSAALKNGNLASLEASLKKVPDAKTLKRLLELAPLLQKIPDPETLEKLLDKAEEFKLFIDNLEVED